MFKLKKFYLFLLKSRYIEIKNPLYKKHIISINDFSRNELEYLLVATKKIKYFGCSKLLKNKIIASCFFESSTRTRLSFEAAIYKLGALIIGFSNIQNTALNGKGETLADTISVISKYVDAIIIRHPKEGAAKLASEFSNNKPIFNAGDGSNQHPTQTILDIFSIQETQHRLDNINIAIIGDLKYGRTVHSLVQAMIKFDRNVFYFISPDKLSMPACILNMLDQKNIKYSIHSDIKDIIKYLDIIYMTRIQKERLEKSEFDSINKKFKLNINSLKEARNNLKILHPLPKIDEISCEVDHTPYAYYFQQAENGLFARQALLAKVLSCE